MITKSILLMIGDGIDDDAEVLMAVVKLRMTMIMMMMMMMSIRRWKMVNDDAGAGVGGRCQLLLTVMQVTLIVCM